MRTRILWSTLLALLMVSFKSYGQVLNARIDVSVNPNVWTYTLSNDEPLGSNYYLTSFTLLVAAPISAVDSPPGWTYSSDNATYVFWYNTDPVPPYPHNVSPGASLGGFSVQSTAMGSESLDFALSSWDYSIDYLGASKDGTILSPSSNNSVPEPSSKPFLGAMTVGSSGLLFGMWRRSRRSKA